MRDRLKVFGIDIIKGSVRSGPADRCMPLSVWKARQ